MSVCIQCGKESFDSTMCSECAAKMNQQKEKEVSSYCLTRAEQRELDTLVEDAKDLPRVDGTKLTAEEIRLREKFYRTVPDPDNKDGSGRKYWCNNFHNLFLALYDQKKQPSEPLYRQEFKLKEVEKTGPLWDNFLKENQELVNKILTVLERYPVIIRIRNLTYEIMRKNIWDLEEASLKPVHDRFDPVVGIDCIEMAFWKELDPLLQEAWKAMEKAGVDPRMID